MEKVEVTQESGTLMDLVCYLLDGDFHFVFGFLKSHSCFIFRCGEFLSISHTLRTKRAEISYLQYHTRQ